MARISYSQFSQWDKCPHMWKLNYIDKLGTFTDNIYTIFGTSAHEVIQAYLVCYYERTIKEADALPLEVVISSNKESTSVAVGKPVEPIAGMSPLVVLILFFIICKFKVQLMIILKKKSLSTPLPQENSNEN